MNQRPAVKNLRKLRLDRGLSVVDAARQIGVSAPTLDRAEAGGVPHPRNAFKIAAFFGYQVTDIWPLEDAA